MIIYKTTNLINGKIYIGQSNEKKKSYIGSGTIFLKAVKKYGKKNFKFEIIEKGDFNKDLLDYLEIHYIRLYNSTNKKIGYNIQTGGTLPTISDYTRNKMRTSHLGKKLSNEHKIKIGNSNRGKMISEEQKIAISKANKGRKFSDEIKINMSNGRLGMKLSEEHKRKIGVKSKGRKHSEETKEKMRNKGNIPVYQYDLNLNFIKRWESLSSAGIAFTGSGNISNCFKNINRTCGGFKWFKNKL